MRVRLCVDDGVFEIKEKLRSVVFNELSPNRCDCELVYFVYDWCLALCSESTVCICLS